MAIWILTQKGTVIPRRSICWLTKDECSESNEVEAVKRAQFNADITAKIGDSVKLPSTSLPEFVDRIGILSRMGTMNLLHSNRLRLILWMQLVDPNYDAFAY